MRRLLSLSSIGLLLVFVSTSGVNGKLVATNGKTPEEPMPTATSEPAAYDIPWQSLNAGGNDLSSGSYRLMFSAGQSVAGYAASVDYKAEIGYWYGGGGAAGECLCGNPGDVNNDGGSPSPLDVTFLVRKVYKSQDALYDYHGLNNCPFENGDVDGSGGLPSPLDVTFLVRKVYKAQDALCQDRCHGTPGNCPGP